ncbi:VWA domain-containing protein [Thorsellia anophelis]|uniref:Uncharacterized conserved protein YegL, contains vWA domain of TerY type n=1 Tax=Thorsellia anophelis DSM 18579 TaxID=1123402 RepID=A0A1I0ENL5_9GAMM|nr:VWA domain-containing protein [Thorsellia anophelis]SET47030.1 Uncharacterized conserved protein YegL, contains vWA domain of TerY type [Thorsellia anophelis DSM 18579]
MSRRLLTYICIDTSGSMTGEPIEAVNSGLQSLMSALRSNPYALDSVHLSITTFDSTIKTVLPMTPLVDVVMPHITCPATGATLIGEALESIYEQATRDVVKASDEQKGDWKPILVILTDGKPTDVLAFSEIIPRIKSVGFSRIIACAAGPKADSQQLKRITDDVVSLDTMDAASFNKFFEWVSATFAQSSQTVGSAEPNNNNNSLPPPPPEINIVF